MTSILLVKNTSKFFFVLGFSLILMLALVQALPAGAVEDSDLGLGTLKTELEGGGMIGLEETDPGAALPATVGKIINAFLGVLGIIAVIIIIIGGFKWMTAGGNEDKVGEAKNLLIAGIIGLIIILAAYSIASFVISKVTT